MNYHYPLDDEWSKQEVIDVVNFFLLWSRRMRNRSRGRMCLLLIRSSSVLSLPKVRKKTYFREFEQASGYAAFPVVKKARNSDQKNIRMK